jgi:hypothetical protein
MDATEPNVPAQIGDVATQLRDLAEKAELTFLAHLLGVVILEARKSAQEGAN